MSETRGTINHLVQDALTAAAKNKPIELALAWYVEAYKVIAISNTTILKPGEWLSPAAVDQIDATPGWTTRSADNAVIGAIVGKIVGAAEAVAKV